jgi:hypothetical protein
LKVEAVELRPEVVMAAVDHFGLMCGKNRGEVEVRGSWDKHAEIVFKTITSFTFLYLA